MKLIKRRDGNDGTSMQAARALPVRQSLIYSVLGVTERERKAAKVYHGSRPATGAKRCELTDADFLRIRALRQFKCMSFAEIASLTGQPVERVRQVTEYKTRVHLEPCAADAESPADATAKDAA